MMAKLSAQDKRELQAATMGCWWPSKVNGRTSPDFEGMRGELVALMDAAYTRAEFNGEPQTEFNALARLYDLAGSML